MSKFLYTNSGASSARTSLMSVGLLARAGAQQVETLSYADCFLFMAMVGGLAFCFIPLLPPFVAAPKPATSESDREGNAANFKGNVHPSASFGNDAGIGQALAFISFKHLCDARRIAMATFEGFAGTQTLSVPPGAYVKMSPYQLAKAARYGFSETIAPLRG